MNNMEEQSNEKPLNPTEQLIRNGQSPKKVLTDAGTVHQFDLDEQIQLDKYRRAVEYAENPRRGLGIKLFKISPDGAPW